jgi:hypothetical protein
MKKLSVVACTFVWILRGIIFIVIMVIHIRISYWRRDNRPYVCIAYSVTIYVSGFGKFLVIVCIFAWILLENIVYCFIRDHDFNIFWLLVFQMLRFYLHWWDINCRNGHMQNLNFLQFRYFVIYFVIFLSMDWETESHSRYFCMDIHIFISGQDWFIPCRFYIYVYT